ncbi:MAG TPA: NAD-dependent protein deacylase [Candidatus Acidoferrum sp.]|nr:NAD-dependent protein deacylase [Candidatus Acidoferrum sp.]
MTNLTEVEKLRGLIEESTRIVFFGGAGVSTESGIPDFRSEDGLYSRKYDYPPEVMLSRDFFDEHPAAFFKFYRETLAGPDVKPNRAHWALAKLEQDGKLTAVVTQNIDGLHQAAGSRRVYELHGSVARNTCMRCGKNYPGAEVVRQAADIPRCSCGGIIKPDVVLYGEDLPRTAVSGAVRAMRQADLLIVGGTSLVVYPAAGLLRYFHSKPIVLINRDATPYDGEADLVIRRPIGEVLGEAIGV